MIPNPLASRFGRMAAFFLLYMTEGIPLGFTATAIATQMRRQNLSPGQIGMFVGMLYLPWAWKWLVGPVVDEVYVQRLGRRRGWILGMQVLMSIGLMALLPINFSTHLKLFTGLVMLINVFSATQDVAIDALACGVLAEKERGLANGMMFAGAYCGQAVGGSGVLLLAGFVHFNYTFFLVAGCVLAITVLVVLPMREPVRVSAPDEVDCRAETDGVAAKIHDYAVEAIRAFFGTRLAIAALIFALLPSGAYALSLALASNLAVEIGMSDKEIGVLTLISTIISAGGCVVGGFLSDRLGRRRMLGLYIFCTVFPTVYLAMIMHGHGWIMPRALAGGAAAPAEVLKAFWVANIIYAVFQGLLYGTRTALFMDVCTADVAATQFTAYMALLNLVTWYTSMWQGWAIDRWGYPVTLMLDAATGAMCILVLPLIRGKQRIHHGGTEDTEKMKKIMNDECGMMNALPTARASEQNSAGEGT